MRVLREMIELERPTASCVAAALSMNLRTMQRHLAVWDLTFEQLLDEYRLRRAMKYLNEGEHTITDIAFRLGYLGLRALHARFPSLGRRVATSGPCSPFDPGPDGRRHSHASWQP